MESRASSRIPAPTVAPVILGDLRFEQVRNGLLEGFGQMGGCLAAYHVTSGQRLWTLSVYDNQRLPLREGDAQDVFFTSMTALDDGTLSIENERSERFVVDPATRLVVAALPLGRSGQRDAGIPGPV